MHSTLLIRSFFKIPFMGILFFLAACGDMGEAPPGSLSQAEGNSSTETGLVSDVFSIAGLPAPLPSIGPNSSGTGACKNQPVGYTPIADQAFSTVPPLHPIFDSNGWQVQAGRPMFSNVQDQSSPTKGTVIQGRFPKGSPGGSGPFRMDRPLGNNFKAVYMCLSTKISTNFTMNGNSTIKFGFYETPYMGGSKGVNHYFNLFPKLSINLQSTGGTLNRNLVSTFDMMSHRGQWHTMEVLVVGNNVGKSDGVGKMWVDGALVLDKRDVKYFYQNQSPRFNRVTWNPTYGGGLNPVPYDMYQFIDGWFVSVK